MITYIFIIPKNTVVLLRSASPDLHSVTIDKFTFPQILNEWNYIIRILCRYTYYVYFVGGGSDVSQSA